MPARALLSGFGGFAAGLVSGFLPGLLSGYVLLRLTDRRKANRDRSREIYIPLHQQLFEALKQVEHSERPHGVDPNFWSDLEASGLAKGIRRSLRKKIAYLYSTAFPEFEKAWMALNGSDGISKLLTNYDESVGVDVPHLQGGPYISWWRFLLATTFQPSLLGFSDFRTFRIWNKYFIEGEPAAKGRGSMEVIREIWSVAQENPAVRRLQAARELVLTNIPPTLKRINRLIKV
jgi:hypothetical protein